MNPQPTRPAPHFRFPRTRPPTPRITPSLRPAPPPVTGVPPATKSHLVKTVYPLGHLHKSIPTNIGSELDLVFSISASLPAPPASTSTPIVLESLTVLLPAGRDATDLLRVTRADASLLTMLPPVRAVGRGLHWHAVVRESTAYRGRFRHFVRAKGRRVLPSTCLAVHLTMKGGRGGRAELARRPDLSFVLERCAVNALPSGQVDVLFVERYLVGEGGGGEDKKVEEVVTRIVVEKEMARLG